MESNVSVLSKPRLLRQLESVDWDFPVSLPGTMVAPHWYPGTFPSELPATLIQALSQPGQLVFDSYGGVGTTAIEALRQGRRAWTVDLNPIAVLVSYVVGGLVLLSSSRPADVNLMIHLAERQLLKLAGRRGEEFNLHDERIQLLQAEETLARALSPAPTSFVEWAFSQTPKWNCMDAWISESTLEKVKSVYNAFYDVDLPSFVRLIGLVSLSANMRASSSQTKSWGHIADSVKPKEFFDKDTYLQCLKWLSRFRKSLSSCGKVGFPQSSDNEVLFWVSHHSWSGSENPAIFPDEPASVIVTSPPYGGAIDYILSQRLSLHLMGYDDGAISALSGKEIGARRKRFSSQSREDWAVQLGQSIDRQLTYLGHGGYAAFILPHKDAGREVGALAVAESFRKANWEKIWEIDRSIRQLRTRQSWTSIKRETIQFFGNLRQI